MFVYISLARVVVHELLYALLCKKTENIEGKTSSVPCDACDRFVHCLETVTITRMIFKLDTALWLQVAFVKLAFAAAISSNASVFNLIKGVYEAR